MDNEKQKDEIIALESIYNSEEFSYSNENGHYQCTFIIFVNLLPDYCVFYKDIRQTEEPEQRIKISHLPPLTLNIILPENYPSSSPPKFSLYSSWLHLSLQSKLCKKLDKLWEENKGQEIMFTWVAFLQDEALQFLNIQENLNMSYAYTRYNETLERERNGQKSKMSNKGGIEYSGEGAQNKPKAENLPNSSKKSFVQKRYDKRASLDCPIDRNPIQALVDYNDRRNQIQFKKNFYTCKICFVDKLGEHSTQFLPCSHIYCKDCISGYLEVRIKDGNVQNIHCPEEKCTSEITPAQIKDLVSSELFAKYDSILLSATLDTMGDIVYCPRRNCQYPVSREPDEQMASCPNCQYTFCINCKMVYHGIEPCRIQSAEIRELVAQYQEASEERKLQLEQCYGKKQLQSLAENAMSENWIESNSKKCPKCQTAIEKSDGCNKMECWRCNTFFCWLCCSILDRNGPYEHFQNVLSNCYDRLYHGMRIQYDDEEEDVVDMDDVEDYDFLNYLLGDGFYFGVI